MYGGQAHGKRISGMGKQVGKQTSIRMIRPGQKFNRPYTLPSLGHAVDQWQEEPHDDAESQLHAHRLRPKSSERT